MSDDQDSELHRGAENILRDLHVNLKHHEDNVVQARELRDQQIVKAHTGGMSMYRIAQVIGISQQAVRQIVKANQ